jgi:hypothetical protein
MFKKRNIHDCMSFVSCYKNEQCLSFFISTRYVLSDFHLSDLVGNSTLQINSSDCLLLAQFPVFI